MMKRAKLFIVVLIFILSNQLISQSRENIYYFPLGIQKELVKTIDGLRQNQKDVFLVIDNIFDDGSVAFWIVPFEKSRQEMVSYGFIKVKDSGRITYIDGSKYYVLFKSDLYYSTKYKSFMSLLIKEQEKLLQDTEKEEDYALHRRFQVYEYAKYIKITP